MPALVKNWDPAVGNPHRSLLNSGVREFLDGKKKKRRLQNSR